jgi:hypothetical protein
MSKRLFEKLGYRVIASEAKQSLLEKEIASSPAAPRNDSSRLLLRHAPREENATLPQGEAML